MGFPDAASDPAAHLYPQAIQLKLYQAFIFSIPVLFSVILFLLFYLFYLKRTSLAAASASTSPSLGLPRTTATAAQSTYLDAHTLCQKALLKEKLKEILPSVPFDEDLQAKDTICSVCLGEFETAEELIQIPVCKHIFHLDCIHHWLYSHSTCPLCRCSVYRPITRTTRLIVVGPPLSAWQSVLLGGADQSSEVVPSVANLLSQELVIEVGDFTDRIDQFTDSSLGE